MTIEPRNLDECWSLPVSVKGDRIVLSAKAKDSAIRPGSEGLAEVHVGILGTCEGLTLPVKKSRNGMKPREQRPRSKTAFPRLVSMKTWKETGCRRSSSRQERRDGASGRLSRLIVAFESRETLLWRSL